MFSWSVPSRLAAVTYLEDTASVLGIQIYQLKIATQLTWIITERWAVDYGSNALNHSRLQSLCSVFGGVGPRPQFWAVEKSLGLLLSPNCLPIKRPCNFSLRRSQWPIIGAKIFSSGIKEELGESLPRTQTSLSQRKAGRRTPFHVPLPFIISHSRFALASVRKTKHLRRRLGESLFIWLSGCLVRLRRVKSFASPCDHLERLHLPLP